MYGQAFRLGYYQTRIGQPESRRREFDNEDAMRTKRPGVEFCELLLGTYRCEWGFRISRAHIWRIRAIRVSSVLHSTRMFIVVGRSMRGDLDQHVAVFQPHQTFDKSALERDQRLAVG